MQREADARERTFLSAHGAVSIVATLPTMVRAGDNRSTLVELKAVDQAYPLLGTVTTEPAMPLADALARRGDLTAPPSNRSY